MLLRVTNHTGQTEKNLLGPAGIRTRDLRFNIVISNDHDDDDHDSGGNVDDSYNEKMTIMDDNDNYNH